MWIDFEDTRGEKNRTKPNSDRLVEDPMKHPGQPGVQGEMLCTRATFSFSPQLTSGTNPLMKCGGPNP